MMSHYKQSAEMMYYPTNSSTAKLCYNLKVVRCNTKLVGNYFLSKRYI